MTSPSSLFVTICYGEQYRKTTPYGMWYLFLKTSILAGESTKCLNLPIWTSQGEITEVSECRNKNQKAEETGQGEKKKFKETKTYKN